jgi:hypothetical protein
MMWLLASPAPSTLAEGKCIDRYSIKMKFFKNLQIMNGNIYFLCEQSFG